MPAAEVEISVDLVRALLEDQHPDLAERGISYAAEGWDAAMFRLGDDLAVRIPRRALSAPGADIEIRWLPQIAPHLPLPVPAPVRSGSPTPFFPWSWTVVPWFHGQTWADAPVRDGFEAATTLGWFVGALAAPAPPDAPKPMYRGTPLIMRDVAMRQRVATLGDAIDGSAVLAAWCAALSVPDLDGPRRWLHGDLHPANVVVRDARVVAVIDWNDLCGGDWASDLAAGWMCFGPAEREVFRAAVGSVDDDSWARGRGWALNHAVACLESSADNPRMRAVGERTLDAVLADRD
ncbi:MAG: phosphotransferase [Actinobacteria bacterium]|nr:phosphotransferase [Actinomycetota bacterium]